MAIADCASFEALLDRLLSELRLKLSSKYRFDIQGLTESTRNDTQHVDCEAPACSLARIRVEALHSTLVPAERDTMSRLSNRNSTSHEPQHSMIATSNIVSSSSATSPPAKTVGRSPNPSIRFSSMPSDGEDGEIVRPEASTRSSYSQYSIERSTLRSLQSSTAGNAASLGRKRTVKNRISAACQPNTPDATSRVIWDVVMCAVMFLLVIIETTGLAIPECQEGAFADGWGVFLLVVFSFDILVNFNTALVWAVGRKIVVIYDRWEIAKAYFKSWFIIDILTTFPYDMLVGSTSNSRMYKTAKVLRLARLVKGVMRISKTMQYWVDIQESLQERLIADVLGCQGYQIDKTAKYVSRALTLFCCLLIETHILACFLLTLSRNAQSMSWHTSGVEIHALDPFSRYVAAFRDVIYILTTGTVAENLGFHDILLTMLDLWCYIQFTIVISIFVGIKSDPGLSDEDFSIKCSRLRRYLRRHNVIKRVRDEVDSHLSKVGKYAGMNLESLLEELPSTIRQSVAAGLYYPFHERMAFFMQGNQSESFEFDLCASIQSLFYRPRDHIVCKGTALQGLHYMSEGFAAITQDLPNGAQEENDWNPGNYLFLEALFAPRPLCESVGDAEAIEPCETWFLSRAAFDRLLNSNYPSFRKRVEQVRSKVHFSDEFYSWIIKITDEHGEIHYVGLDYLVEDGRFPQKKWEFEGRLSRNSDGSIKRNSTELSIARRTLPPGKTFHYFLSHRKQHSKLGNRPELVAQSLHDALDAYGFTGFFDVDHLVEISKPKIEEAVRASCAMIVIINDETAESEWCRLEWECAAKNGIPVKCVVDAQHSCKGDLLSNIRDVNPALLQYQWSEYLDRYRKSVAKDLVEWLLTTVNYPRVRRSIPM